MTMIPLDAIRVISLAQRQDRRDALMPELERAIGEGVIPDVPVEFVNRYPRGRTLVPASWPHMPGYWAASREHFEVLMELWSRGSHLALILEDDAQMLPAFYSEASAFFHEVNAEHPDWLAMFLGGHDVHGYEERSERVLLSRGSTQCHAYLVNPPGMWRLVDHLWCRPFEIVDWAYADLMRRDACIYRPRHWMVTTRAGWSDNRQEEARQGE